MFWSKIIVILLLLKGIFIWVCRKLKLRLCSKLSESSLAFWKLLKIFAFSSVSVLISVLKLFGDRFCEIFVGISLLFNECSVILKALKLEHFDWKHEFELLVSTSIVLEGELSSILTWKGFAVRFDDVIIEFSSSNIGNLESSFKPIWMVVSFSKILDLDKEQIDEEESFLRWENQCLMFFAWQWSDSALWKNLQGF